jgi:hypothetical protein
MQVDDETRWMGWLAELRRGVDELTTAETVTGRHCHDAGGDGGENRAATALVSNPQQIVLVSGGP